MSTLIYTRMKRKHLFTWLLAGVLGAIALFPAMLFGQAQAQDAGQDQESGLVKKLQYGDTHNHATILGWGDRMRMYQLDRFHSLDGFVTDRGAFQFYVPGMDEEYHLDLFTYRFTMAEDYRWYSNPNGLRTYVGSVNVLNFATVTELKSSVQLSGKHRIDVELTQEENLQARRVFAVLSYRYNLMPHHWIGFSHTAGSYKPDLDLNLFYQVGNFQDGFARFTYTFADLYNNAIYDGLGVESNITDTSRSYESLPGIISFQLSTPKKWGLRAEFTGGFQLENEATIGSLGLGSGGEVLVSRRYRQREANNYLGALIEYSRTYLTAGVLFQRHFTAVRRDTVGESSITSRYRAEQNFNRLGAFVMARSEQLEWESWVYLQNYQDRQTGENFALSPISDSLDYKENRVMLRNRISWKPPYRGLILGIEHLLDMRDFPDDDPGDLNSNTGDNPDFQIFQRYLASDASQLSPLTDTSSRLTLLVGYQFHPRARIVAGVGYDLDNDLNSKAEQGGQRFDNGFARIELTW